MKKHYVSVVEGSSPQTFQQNVNEELSTLQKAGAEEISISFGYDQGRNNTKDRAFIDVVPAKYIAMIHYTVEIDE